MPALEKTGVKLVAEDYEKFVKALMFAGRAVTHLEKKLSAFTATVTVESQKAATSLSKLTKAQELQLRSARRRMEVMQGEWQFRKMVSANRAKQLQAEVALAKQYAFAEQKQREATEATGGFIGAITQLFQKGQKLPGVLGKASGAAAGLGKAFAAGSVGAAALATGIGVALVAALAAAIKITGKVISKIKELSVTFAKAAVGLIEEAAMLGGRFMELELAAIATGRGIGLADETILRAIKSVNAMNIRYDVAAATIMRMARVQIDLKYATDLVRIAQAMAIETGRDSSEEMTSLTHALTTNNVQMLRRHGIIIDNDKAERDYAEANNLVVGSLTARQKIEAQVQAVIKESTHLMGVYEAAMRSGAKIMRSIESRLIPEFVAALGAPMQGAFSEVARSAFEFLEALTASITEGGRFYPTMVKIGAVLQLVGEAFSDLTRTAIGFLEVPKQIQELGDSLANLLGPDQVAAVSSNLDETGTRINTWFEDLAIAAFEWGATIMEQFAHGITAGLHFIGEAMLLVADVVAYWMASFSPPRIAPDIAKWGAAAMAEYLRGFGMVDFGAFEGIQKVLDRLLSGPDLAGLLGEVIEAMATGTVGEDLFGRIAAATGAFGAEIVKLTKLQFKYADALRAVEAAQLALTRAQEAVKGHSIEVDKLVREYNKLLRAGAGDEILDTRLAEINASERARNVAIVERDEAQVAIKLAEERLAPIKEALALQEKLVDVLLDLASAQADVVAKTKKAAKGGAEAILEEFGGLGARIGGEFQTNMQKAIDRIKGRIAARLKDIFQPVWDAWFGKLVQTIPSAVLGGGVPPTAEFGGGVVQAFAGVQVAFEKLTGAFEGVDWEKIKETVGIFTENMALMGGPLGELARLLDLPTWDELVKGVQDLADALKWMRDNQDWLFPLLSGRPMDVGFALAERWWGPGAGMTEEERGAWWRNVPSSEQAPPPPWGGAAITLPGTELGAGLTQGMITGMEAEAGIASLSTFFQTLWGKFKDIFDWGGSPAYAMTPVGAGITEGIAAGMQLPEGMESVFASMQFIANEMLAAAAPDATTPLANTLIAVGAAFTGLIGKGIKENVGKIIGAMDEAVRRAREYIAQLGDEAARRSGWPGTPPPGDSQQQGGYSPRGGVHHPGEYVIPAGLTRALMQPVSHTNNFQIGPNNISQSIDQAHLLSLIDNRIRSAIARAH